MMPQEPNKVDIHFIKSGDFRTAYINGVFGGFTPRGQLNIDFFSERIPIPTKISYVANQQDQDKVEMKEVDREGKNGAVREFHFGVIMDMDTAREMRAWLDDKLRQYDEAVEATLK
ncbi:hypothetical protein [Spirosoma sp. KUDC1026]|uniref:hypothetical protein n=1 Tax=Spirosoma sp. KUDC1026 TaxID=2745947 RepID=UPI00159BE5A0|nr:hypothetical protein [Spirosoma sp. KUDC1026]QKZ13986.1 hypothetical protein HU175_15655 [Spirosoma sp. KUDC1026]